MALKSKAFLCSVDFRKKICYFINFHQNFLIFFLAKDLTNRVLFSSDHSFWLKNGRHRFTFILYTSWHHSSFWSYTYEQTLPKHLPSSSGQNSSSIQIRFRWHRIRHETLLTIFSRRTRLELMLRDVGTGMGAGGAMVSSSPRSLQECMQKTII